MTLAFKKASRAATKLRAAFDGPSGSGKTYTALRLAFGLVAAGLAKRVAVIDTEHGSAAKYAGEAPDGVPWEFDTLELTTFGPLEYVAALEAAFQARYDAVVVDSLSHAWTGTGGALDIVDRKAGSGNKFTAWKDVTPMHNKLIDTIIQAPAHVVGTMRSKSEYVLEQNDRGKMVPRKVGTSPIQREGMEYEFDVYGSIDLTHQLHISKTRCSALDGASDLNVGPRFWGPLFGWLRGDAAPRQPEPTPPPKGQPATDRDKALRAAVTAANWSWAACVAWLNAAYPEEPVRYTERTRVADIEAARVEHLTRHLNTVAVQGK
ncbi:AAA ATPase OS=Herpetosiphon aurantiacus (strain ATCC 23779 / DSM 785) GN=Haur_1402 PE=4 SV=1 [Gemmataceae bacterium]|nr:AAA ATPase OS=Herpetosiphon aurantiacus (strain ATCC 23779 / DSM 785) GN=Haur_1402 PE=4 SV=1 [Gemmataceae bacterium]VTT96524.1 AAA ATPase OS=Herpetosiphon aurantiacus (strain ATCC 23779 / DSM 785) GN=Haur_1402 PE=4 SV=1 [Gemmataceae bacterium]